MTLTSTLTGEMQAMVQCARGRWHRYIELRRWAAEAERMADLDKYRRWTTEASEARTKARGWLFRARVRKAMIEAALAKKEAVTC